MSQIHILDGQTDEILDYVQADNIIDDSHKKSLEDSLETFNFIAFGDKPYAEHIGKRNRLIIPDEDGTYREFVIFEAPKYRDTEGLKVQAFSHASYLELKKSNVIYPNKFKGTISQHAGRALNKTGWQVGIVEGAGDKTISINEHTSPYDNIRRIAKDFKVELRFRVETDGSKITGRYVDFLERIGEWRGREVEFGKDLVGIRRVEKQDVVTALLGLGPEREDGTRLEVLVEDFDALQRWGWYDEHGNLNHLIEPYEIQSERTEMTDKQARQYTKTALEKRINTQVTYECEIADLEQVAGLEHEKIRFGDTIKIKDTEFNPPLYVEARVFEQERSIVTNEKKSIKLGDFIEYTEEQVHDVWKRLEKQIKDRVSHYEMVEYTYNKLTIDEKDETVFEEGKTFSEATGIQAREYAKAFAVEEDNKIRLDTAESLRRTIEHSESYSEQQANSALEQAKMYSVAKEVYENQMNQIAQDMASKAGLEYVDGKLVVVDETLGNLNAEVDKKADGSTVYTIEDVDNMINNTVSKTQYETDQQGVVEQLESHGTRLGQNEKAIGLKADRTELNQVENSLSTQIANVEVKADQVTTRVESVEAEVDGLEYENRNLLRNSGDFKTTQGWSNSPKIVKIDNYSALEFNGYSTNNSGADVKLEQSSIYTYSGIIAFNKDVNSDNIKWNQPLRFQVRYNGNNQGGGKSSRLISKHEGTIKAGTWIKIIVEIETIDNANGDIIFSPYIYGNDFTDTKYWIRYMKLEKGNKATDWSPAPEDTEEEINGLKGRVNTAEGEIRTLAGEVSLKASQSTVDSLEQRVSTAEGELQVLPGQINAKVSKDGAFGELNLSPDKAKLNFDRVEIDGKLEAKHIKSLNGLNVNDQFIVDNAGNVKFGGNLQGASGTFGDVTVTDGDFNLQDEVTGNRYSATPRRNILKDHSFELVRQDVNSLNADSVKYNWLEMLDTTPFHDSPWHKVRSPKVAVVLGPHSKNALPIFGEKAVIVKNAHYVRQYVYDGIGAGSKYTVSGFFKRQWGQTPGKPVIQIWHVDAQGSRLTKITRKTFPSVKSDYSISRYANTFTVPSGFGIGDSLEVIVSGGDSNWVQCDGVQMVEGDRPSIYLPEDNIWDIANGYIMPSSSQSTLWVGERYPTESQSAVPSKTLNECPNGWILQWQAYDKGSGTREHNFQYSFIPKIVASMQNGKGTRFVLARGLSTVYKYVYIHNDKVIGHSINNEGNRHELALTSVYQW